MVQPRIASPPQATPSTAGALSKQGAPPAQDTRIVCEVKQPPRETGFNEVFTEATDFAQGLGALLAVVIAVKALRMQAGVRPSERRSATYHSLVIEPSIAKIPAFEAEATDNINRALEAIRHQLLANAGVNDVQREVRSAVETHKRLYAPLFDWLLGHLNAWGDASLRAKAIVALEDIEDLSASFPLVQVDHVNGERLVADLRERVAKLLQIVVHYDTDAPVETSRTLARLPMGFSIARKR